MVTSKPSLSFALLCILLAALWLAGGASRADAYGQVVVRAVAWSILLLVAFFGAPPSFRALRAPALVLALCIGLIGLQLMPLPPEIWQGLPGRSPFVDAMVSSGQAQLWRPLAIVPSAAINAVSALIVPAAALVLLGGLRQDERALLPGLMLGFILAALLIGVAQISGAIVDNPFVNDTPGQVAGPFANRNHFALYLAFGCVLTPAWAFSGSRQSRWRLPVAAGLVVLLVLAILATGSRAGIVLGFLAISLGLLIVRKPVGRVLRSYPRWVLPAIGGGVFLLLTSSVAISLLSNRAPAIERLFISEPGEDMRTRAIPTVIAMIKANFPVGAGYGSFDAEFRMHEPTPLLKQTYFNHAHNDYLEIVLDGGIAGIILLAAAIIWWSISTWRAWRSSDNMMAARIGSALIFLVLVASAFDYPARTPMIMAMVAIGAGLLSWGGRTATR